MTTTTQITTREVDTLAALTALAALDIQSFRELADSHVLFSINSSELTLGAVRAAKRALAGSNKFSSHLRKEEACA